MTEKLENGITVLTKPMPHLRSVSTGVWVRGGSIADPSDYSGIAHYCEHMAFKGTPRRTAAEIAEQFDAMGGYVNAYTAKLHTCYYCTTLDSHAPRGLDLLADMVLSPSYGAAETEVEKKVILEEIAMCEDSPEDLVMARLSEGVWRGSPLGREILGKAESVGRITPEILRDYQRSHYTGSNIIISAAGGVDEKAFLEDCRRLFGRVPAGEPAADLENGSYTRSCSLEKKDIEQNHICLGFRAFPMFDERRYTLSVFSALTGGTMSSRLFRKIREEAGLAYNVQSYLSPYLSTGLFCIYTALAPSSQEKCLKLMRSELDNIRENGFTDDEVIRAKEQLKSSMILDLENSSSHMKLIAKRVMYGKGETDADEIIRNIDAVTREGLTEVAREILNYPEMSLSVVGTAKKESFYRGFFA